MYLLTLNGIELYRGHDPLGQLMLHVHPKTPMITVMALGYEIRRMK